MAWKTLFLLAICKLVSSVPDSNLNVNVKTVVNARGKEHCRDSTCNKTFELSGDSKECNDDPEELTLPNVTQQGLSYIEPDDNQCKLTTKQIVMKSSAGSATRGIFLSLHEKDILKIRRQAIEVLDNIELLGSDLSDKFFSREFEEKTSSQDFLKVVDIFGIKIATKANFQNLFVKVKGGVTVNYDREQETEQNTKSSSKYVSAIKGYNVPIKSIDLNPWYIRLNERVLEELTQIENKIAKEPENQTIIFDEYFEKYGSHFIFGLFEFGGTIIIKSEASFSGSSSFEEYKETVKRAVDAYAELSITVGVNSGGGSVKTNAKELKNEISGSSNDEILKSISLEREKKGGPPGDDDIDSWKKGLAEQCDTWRIIDKPSELITTWDLIMMHHTDNFKDAKDFTSLMKKAWETIIEEELLDLPSEFKKLGTSTATANKRRHLLVVMMSQEPVFGVKDNNKSALVSVITGGQVVMSALQSQVKKLDPDTTNILPFDSIQFLPERPYKVYLRLEYNNLYLGDIIIVLNGPYPNRTKQFLELSTGYNQVGGSWKGAGFDEGLGIQSGFGEALNHTPAEFVSCTGYRNISGLHTGSLFNVTGYPSVSYLFPALSEGLVLGRGGQVSGFNIITRSNTYITWQAIVIGTVISGLDILQSIAAMGDDFVKDITFSNCGLVVID